MDIKQLKAAIANAPEDATHVCLENGTHYQFKIKGLSAEVYGDNEWVSYDGCALPDLENVSLLSDIKAIVTLQMAETRLDQAEKTLKTIASNPGWLDHHCHAQACLDIITVK